MSQKVRSSLSLKITLMLLVVFVAFFGGSWFFARESAKSNLSDYYKRIAKYVSGCSYDVVKYYIHDPDKNIDKMKLLAKEMTRLCEDDFIDMVYIVEENKDNIEQGDTLLIALEDTREIKGVNGYSNVYDLSTEEIEIMNGQRDEATVKYQARIGEVVSFIYGYDIVEAKTGENTRVLVGINIKQDLYHSSIRDAMLKLLLGMILFLLLIIVIIRIIIHRTAIAPYRVLSKGMKNFIQNDQVHFEPLAVEGIDERAQVTQAFNVMGRNIESYINNINQLEGERQKSLAEMTIASDIQRGLLPKADYAVDSFVLKGYMKPAQNIGGDLYYYYRIDEDRLAFAIGDVSGKGISAALFMASTVGAIKYNLKNCTSPANAMKAINNDIIENNPNRLFVTLFLGILDAKTHTVTYTNAGHNPPYRIGDAIEPLAEGKGICAGIFADEEYQDAVIKLQEGETLFLYTDGVTEAVNEENAFFGESRLEQQLLSNQDDVIESILQEMQDFTQNAEQHDDITMLTLGFREKQDK